MASKYYIAIRPQTNEHHAVHKGDCPFLPDNEKRIYLGKFGSGSDAVIEGQRLFPSANSCLFCSKERQTVMKRSLVSVNEIAGNIPTIDQISIFQMGKMFYFLN
jgi:hypothetical protein